MKGLEISHAYFEQAGMPMISKKFTSIRDRVAAGLVGEGSECFGFDDEISRDHDFGPSFCLWLNKEDFAEFGNALQHEYDALPSVFAGYPARITSDYAGQRVGVFETGSFYRRFLGISTPPGTLLEWQNLPEVNLAAATNGNVFFDPLGEFTHFRKTLLLFYPEDVRLKKISLQCVAMAQSGQYNYQRSINHGEFVAAQQSLAIFADAAISMIYLLNKRYKPFYKWMHRGLLCLPILGGYAHLVLDEICSLASGRESARINCCHIEDLCTRVIHELHVQNLSSQQSDFLLDHAQEVANHIENTGIISPNILEG